jgi:diadenosine tetraphosphate (Ap4A) HIT family hydrolase
VWFTTRLAVAALRDEYRPDGFNVGLNLGQVAGTGLPGHLHVHVMPCWGRDTNFMPIVVHTKYSLTQIQECYFELFLGIQNGPHSLENTTRGSVFTLTFSF